MNCEQIRELLPDYLGQELDPAGRETVERHLAACETCRSETESLLGALRALRQLEPPPAMPATGSGPVRQTSVLRLRRFLLQPLAYAATLLIGVGIGWLARPAPQTSALGRTEAVQPLVIALAPGSGVSSQDLTPFVRNALTLSAAFTRSRVP